MGFNPNLIRTIDVEMRSSDIDALRNDLENYISKIIDYPLEKFNGKGIVFTAGGVTHVTCLWVSINILRELGCCLPIEIWHVGNEISADVMTEFAGLNVQFLDLNDYEIIDSPGYYVKPLAILHSTFKEVLYMDADNICCRNPEYLFQLEAYKTTGTVFWADYWFTDKENPIWKIVDCDNFGLREQESGQILINKEQCWRALNVCVYFNNLGRYYYRLLYGDKDTFKFSWVALKLEFYMIPHNPATCGELREGVFSGNTIVQFDQIGEPLFFHRNLLKWDVTLASERKWEYIKKFHASPKVEIVHLRTEKGKKVVDFNGDFDLSEVPVAIGCLEDTCLSFLKKWRESKSYYPFLEHMHFVNNRFKYKEAFKMKYDESVSDCTSDCWS
ncbi:hypothetical protein D7322_28015 [Sphingobacterium puteale]|uniref:Uncharacterized protein n=1 Tax=Sphingobacterium puteale TaxID=2420510 RepID=A0A420VPM7_9SPHI|nr:hypothetical protein [Sphingobacterium puteale]RKO68290.1 hypothetical protein D7322_28015 [Sphingobacterium puteale]